jgi:hypothetical protein
MSTARRFLRIVPFIIAGISPVAHAEPVWVQVRQSMVRAKPVFYSPGISNVSYGDQLERVGSEGTWIKVQGGGIQGFLPLSSVSADRIVLVARDITKVKADAGDVILAGKGFSREVEQQYRKTDPKVRYDLVDRVEREARVSNQAVAAFAKSGGLE